MSSIRYGRRAVANFAELVGSLPDGAVASATRSTIPLLDYWREPGPRLKELARLLGTDALDEATLTFEYAFPVADGKGKASYTDLMIATSTTAIAIEAKYTEPPYESVGSWLGKSPTQNRQKVLGGWIEKINIVAGSTLDSNLVHSVPYQLIHRTASACSLGRQTQWVVYQVFGGSTDYVAALTQMAGLLKHAPSLRFAVLVCPFEKLTTYAELEGLGRTAETGEAVRRALVAGPLFSFQPPKARLIAPSPSVSAWGSSPA